MLLSADLWSYGEHSNTRKRLAAVLLGSAGDEIALIDIMERHKTMINHIVIGDGQSVANLYSAVRREQIRGANYDVIYKH